MSQKPAYHELEQRIVALQQEIEKLRFESIKYRTLFNHFPVGISVSDSSGQIIETNEIAEELLGVKKEEHEKRAIDGQEWRIIRLDGSEMPSDEWASIIALREKRLVTHCEMGIAKSNDQVTWIDVAAAPLPVEGLGVVITYTDISEKIEARKKQMENENKFRLFFENAGFYGYMLSPEGVILEVNNTALSALGYSREEIIGRPLSALYARENWSNAEKAFEEWQVNGCVGNVELVVQAKDGTKRDVLLNADSVRDDSGRIIHSTSLQVDITDRKKMEAQLEKYKNIVSSTADGISFLDMDYRYIIVNEAYEKFSGVLREGFIGLTVAEYLGKDVFEKYIKPYFDRCLQGETINYQEWFEYPTLGRRFIDITYYPYRDSSGRISGVIANTRDITIRKQSDEQLRFQAMLLEAVEQAVIVTDLSGQIVYWNPFAVKLYGWSAEEAIGKTTLDLIATRESTQQSVEIMSDLQAGKCWTGEYLAKNRDGKKLTTLCTVSPLRGNNGEVTHLIGVSSDISERKQMEMNLRLHEVIVSAATEPMAVIDRQYTYLLVNKSYGDLGGVSRKEIIGKRISDLLGEDVFHNTVKEKVDQCLRGDHVNYSDWFQSPTKGARYMNVNYYPYKKDNGDVVGLINISYDFTEQKQLEDLLRKSEEQHRFLMESITDSVYVLDRQWRHVMVNQAASGFTRLPREQLIGGKLTELFPGVEDTVFFKTFQNVMKNRLPDTVVGEYIFANGGSHWCEVFVYPVPQGILCISRDITEIKKLENRIQQAQKMESIGTLAGGIAHDFNNILFPIIGLSEMLLDDLPQGSPEWENAEEIFKAGKRGSDLVKQILAFSRQSEHKMIPTRVQNILKEVVKLSRSTIPSNIEISQNIQPDCGLILANPTQVHQIAMNIITNAYHAVEENSGQINIRLREINLEASDRLEPGKYVVLSISDTGHGVPANLINNIFDPYFTTKEQGKGTGLGLAVVHGIVKVHKGDVTVSSEVGKGTTFSIYLPLLEKTKSDDPLHIVEESRSGTERILLVDDEVSIAKLGKRMLERIGYHVTMRTSSPDALEAFKVNPSNYDLVISDMTMPNMTGIQLAQELKTLRPDIPIIICTGFSERINEKRAEMIGIEGFIMKPVMKSELSKIIRKVLDESKAKTK